MHFVTSFTSCRNSHALQNLAALLEEIILSPFFWELGIY